MSGVWVSVPATEVQVGDRVRVASGNELTVTRIDRFFGRDDLYKLVESTPDRWFAQGVPVGAQVEVQREER